MSLRLRLALSGAVAVLFALGLAAAGLMQLFSAHVERRAVAELGVQLDQVLAGLERGPQGLTVARPPADPRFAVAYGGLYWQIEEGQSVRRSRSLWDVELALPADTLGETGVQIHHLDGPQASSLLVLERSVTLLPRLGGGRARAAVAMDRAGLKAAEKAFLADFAPSLAVLAVVLIAAGWVQLSVGLRPLRGLKGRVAALRAGDATRMGADWPVEVGPLATEIDGLLAARETRTVRARARAADLAHGLKTPLQALLGEAERLRAAGMAEQAAAIEETALAMQRTVDRELARTRAAEQATTAQADVAATASRIIAVVRRTPDGGSLDWQTRIGPGMRAALHEADLAEALGALSENAARHADSLVTIAARRDGERIYVTVSDDGPGVDAAQRSALVQRHARADEGGTGLGLAIAADIADAAGGSLTLNDAETGGLAATLVVPAASSRAK